MKKGLLVIAAVVALGACSQDYKGLGDAGVGKQHEAKREVIVMSDKFANVETACDPWGHRIYVNTRDAGFMVVIPDPSCVKP